MRHIHFKEPEPRGILPILSEGPKDQYPGWKGTDGLLTSEGIDAGGGFDLRFSAENK